MLSLFIFRGEGKINMKSREAVNDLKKKLSIIHVFSFLVSCMTKQFSAGMWRLSLYSTICAQNNAAVAAKMSLQWVCLTYSTEAKENK